MSLLLNILLGLTTGTATVLIMLFLGAGWGMAAFSGSIFGLYLAVRPR
jgi:hypothetical protein